MLDALAIVAHTDVDRLAVGIEGGVCVAIKPVFCILTRAIISIINAGGALLFADRGPIIAPAIIGVIVVCAVIAALLFPPAARYIHRIDVAGAARLDRRSLFMPAVHIARDAVAVIHNSVHEIMVFPAEKSGRARINRTVPTAISVTVAIALARHIARAFTRAEMAISVAKREVLRDSLRCKAGAGVFRLAAGAVFRPDDR